MENRVSKLEQAIIGIDGKLSRLGAIETQLVDIKTQLAQTAKATDVAEIKGQLAQMPKATEFGNLRAEVAKLDGRVANLPTMWQMILGFIGIILAILWKTK